MTIREFWHDIRERFTDDGPERRDWRDVRRYDRDDQFRQDPNRDMRSRSAQWERPHDRDRAREAETRRILGSGTGFTSASYDPGVWRGGTWSADERSSDWQRRQIDDYAEPHAGYTDLGWPDRYASNLYGVSYRGRGPQNWRRDDNRIREDVCELMTEDDDLDPSDIEVQVQNGEVTLTGTVERRENKRRAEDLSERVSGVRDVHNHLQVRRARDTFLGPRDALAGSTVGSNPPSPGAWRQ